MVGFGIIPRKPKSPRQVIVDMDAAQAEKVRERRAAFDLGVARVLRRKRR